MERHVLRKPPPHPVFALDWRASLQKSELLSLVMPLIQMHFSSKPINNKRKQLTFLNTLRN